jgi:hypothetical protein
MPAVSRKEAPVGRFSQVSGQPRATSGNLKTEFARSLVLCFQGFAKSSGNLGNLFESLTHARGEMSVSSPYRRSWQKVAQVARERWKWLSGSDLIAGNLENEVARGCPRLPGTGVL